MSQRDLAKEFGFTHVYVHYLETGKSAPNAKLILKMARFFNVTPDILLLDEVDLPPE
ncbi:MAG: helix-turn-helix transcriptional regulator [Chloroflexaceae bacterium]|nr:helix-turn-helix transcriptional regulator [Chloroflexaceae bacterium]